MRPVAAGRGNAHRVVADRLLRPAPGRDLRAGVGAGEEDHRFAAGEQAVRRVAAEMVAVAAAAIGDTGLPREPDCRVQRLAGGEDRKSTRLNYSHYCATRMPSSA